MTKKNLLIIEDDKFLARAYSVALSHEEYEVKIIFDGQEAKNYLAEYTPDLIVLDLLLPKVNGFEILADFRKKNTKVPVLVASNLGSNEDIDRSMQLGATDYIIKSEVSISMVTEKIKSLLK